MAEIKIKRPYIKILGTYVDSQTKLKIFNGQCGHAYDQVPASISRGYGCPICRQAANGQPPISHEAFMKKFNKLDSDFIILDEYKGVEHPLMATCKHCGDTRLIGTRYLLAGAKCNDCNGIRKHFNKDIAYETISQKYEILSDFEKATDWIDVKCKGCGNVFNRKVAYLFYQNDNDCVVCSNRKINDQFRLGNEEYQKRLDEMDTNIIAIEDYVEADTLIKHRCLKCGHEFMKRPGDILYIGSGCPHCHCQRSKGETRIANYLDTHNIKYTTQKKYPTLKGTGGKSLRFDFYLDDCGLLIEYQGQYHDGIANSFAEKCSKQTKIHDVIKKEFVEANSLELLEIWYWDFDNIEEILERELRRFPI